MRAGRDERLREERIANVSTATKRTPIIGPMPLTPEWHDIHSRIVSATAIARIMRGEAFAVYYEMRGEVEAFKGNEFTQDGNDLQRGVLAMYARRAKASVADAVPFLIDADCLCLGATPDALAVPANGQGPVVTPFSGASLLADPLAWCVEAKTSTSPAIARQLGEEESDELPEWWIWQGQVQAAVANVPYVEFPVLLFGRIRIFKMQRNETLVAKCREVAEDMAARLRDGRPPESNFSSPADQDAIRSLYGTVDTSKTATLSDSAVAAWREYKALGPEETTLKAKRKALQSIVLAEMGEAGIGLANGVPYLKRKIVEREGYTVAATSYPQLTAISK